MTGQRDVLARCVGVSREYGVGDGTVCAVVDATCAVHRDDRIAVTGRSGSGKSTLLHLLAGLEEPTSGTADRAVSVGVVFQSPSLHSDLSVVENAALAAVLTGVAEDEAFRRALEALDLVGIGGLRDQMPETLSGGQAQRAAIARVLTARPALILADEPTGHLDQASADVVVEVLTRSADVLDAGLVVATHDEWVAASLPERWSMTDGRLSCSVGAEIGP